jgi:MFS family permease
MLAVARVVSVPSKLLAGHRSDRAGALPTAAMIGVALALLGAGWTLAPVAWIGLAPAVVFAAGVSGLGPVTNVLGLEAFGHRGTMLGLFRSLQIAIGAATSAAIGVCTSWFGLRPTLLVAAVLPVALAPLGRRARRRSGTVVA